MKKIFFAITVALAMFFCADANAQFSQLEFGSYRIAGLKATSFTSLDGTLQLQVTNKWHKYELKDISGIVYKRGEPFLIGTADDITVPSKQSTLNVNGHVSLSSPVMLFKLIADPSIDPSIYTIDVQFDVKTRFKTERRTFSGIPLSLILKNI